jgi:hypothetical protein
MSDPIGESVELEVVFDSFGPNCIPRLKNSANVGQSAKPHINASGDRKAPGKVASLPARKERRVSGISHVVGNDRALKRKRG